MIVKEVTMLKSWQDIRDEKKAEQLSRIPKEWILESTRILPPGATDLRPSVNVCGLLSERELEITSAKYDATSLAAEIAEGRYTAKETTIAFCKRAAVAQQLCNNLTEIMFADAIKKAEKLDEQYKSTGKTIGPLHGVPMTFKECFHVDGYDASNGYISRCFDRSSTTTPVIQLMEEAGAIIIAKTNVPQTMLVADSHNNVFGQTLNPVVSHLTCGGSSGGEGSLSAFRGNALGVGTDVGGSIRIPAAANGVYGYKPTFGILPFIGYAASGWTGMNTGIPAVLGPIGHSVRDLKLFTESIRAKEPWNFDPAVIRGVMEGPTLARKPVIGILDHSGCTPHPPVRRSMRETKQKLQAAGYDVRDFTPLCPDFGKVRAVSSELFTLDGLSYPKRELKKTGEPVVPSVLKIGFWDMPRKTHEEEWEWSTKKGQIQKEMLDAWQQAGIDLLIAPVGAHSAVKPGDWILDMYTVVWNAVDYPAVVVPYTKVDPKLDPKDSNFMPMHELDTQLEALYDPELLAGAPIAIQIIAPRLQDANLLRGAQEIDHILNGTSPL